MYSFREFFESATFNGPTAFEQRVTRALHVMPKADAKPWYSISNKADSGSKKSAEILIYDEIDPWFGVSAGDFANDLNALDADEIVVGINSPGGIVFDGIAIMNALKRHPAKIITRIDGLAASAASFIAMAGDEIQTSKYAEMMIHEAHGVVMGTAEDMREMSKLLVRHNESIASVYADRAGGDVKDWLKLMKNETWFTSEEMVAAGLADTILSPTDESSGADEADSLKNRFDLSVFNYAGRSAAPKPAVRNSIRSDDRPKKGTAKMATTKEHLAEKFELDPELDDDAFNAALDAKLAESESESTDDGDAGDAPAAEPSSEQIAAHAKKLGLALVDSETLDTLKAQAARGDSAAAKLEADANRALVEDAIRAGKIPPAARDKYLTGLATDRETFTARLEALEADTIPVSERGHSLNPDPGASAMKVDNSQFEGWKF